MEWTHAQDALRKVAKDAGITEAEVVASINEAIREAYEKVHKEQDQRAIAMWEKIPCKGEMPDAYELVTSMGNLTAWLLGI